MEGKSLRGLRPPVPGEESQHKEVIERKTCSAKEHSPSYLTCTLSLSNILEDKYGLELFKKFAEEDNSKYADYLNFYFACEGLKQQSNPEKVKQTIGAIYRFLQRSQLAITKEIRKGIKADLRRQISPNPSIFNELQANVEKTIREIIYPNFLKSDLYWNYVKRLKNHQGISDSRYKVYSPCSMTNITDSVRCSGRENGRDLNGSLGKITNLYLPLNHSPTGLTNKMQTKKYFDRFPGDGIQYVKNNHSPFDCIELAETIVVNKESSTFQVVPRTKHMNSIDHRPLKEEELFALLIPKLEEIKLKQDQQGRINKANFEDNKKLNDKGSFYKREEYELSEVIQKQWLVPNETDQDILDQHVSRVWRDITPQKSPNSPSPHIIQSNNKVPANEVQVEAFDETHSIKTRLEQSSSPNTLMGKRASKNFDGFFSKGQNLNLCMNTIQTLNQGNRRSEIENSSSRKDRSQHIKNAPNFFSNKNTSNTNNSTTVVFCFCDEQFPYRTKIPHENPTLKQFKEFLPKSGNFRFFFKTHCDDQQNPIIYEEIKNDNDIVPTFEGKILGLVKSTN